MNKTFLVLTISIFSAVQHERAPRSSHQNSLLHFHVGLGNRLRPFQFTPIGNVSRISGIPLQIQNPSLMDATIPQIPSHYFHQGLIYPRTGILGGFGKQHGGVHSTLSEYTKL